MLNSSFRLAEQFWLKSHLRELLRSPFDLSKHLSNPSRHGINVLLVSTYFPIYIGQNVDTNFCNKILGLRSWQGFWRFARAFVLWLASQAFVSLVGAGRYGDRLKALQGTQMSRSRGGSWTKEWGFGRSPVGASGSGWGCWNGWKSCQERKWGDRPQNVDTGERSAESLAGNANEDRGCGHRKSPRNGIPRAFVLGGVVGG